VKPDDTVKSDAGVTMIELVVSLTIMSVMMAMFTTGIVQMYSAANKAESLATAQSELNTVFLRLDKQVRYAAGISQPQPAAGGWYVGVLTTNTGADLCTAVRLDTAAAQLLTLEWDESNPPTTPTWTVLANNVAAPAGGQPFTLEPADEVSNFDRLRLTIVASTGGNKSDTTTDTDVTFTALNTSLATSSEFVCTRFWSP
jgi:prepilin-type N-terminal cleavage/methylation domain-containing protein